MQVERQMLYGERKEAACGNDAICKHLLADEPRRREIAWRGHERALKNGQYNEAVMEKILDEAQRIFQESR